MAVIVDWKGSHWIILSNGVTERFIPFKFDDNSRLWWVTIKKVFPPQTALPAGYQSADSGRKRKKGDEPDEEDDYGDGLEEEQDPD